MALRRWHVNPAPHRRLNTADRGKDVQRFQTALENRSGLAVPNDGVIGKRTLEVKRKVFWDLGLPTREYPITIGAQANVRWPWTRSPKARQRARQRSVEINPAKDGAKVTVEKIVRIANQTHPELYVVSDFRPGDPKDHGSNDFDKAARDIAYPGVDALQGPPHPHLDDAIVVIGEALKREYVWGETVIDTFVRDGWRIQIIWRTPKYGGHLGHIHCGCHQL